MDSTLYSDLQRPQVKFWFQRDNKVLKLYGQTSTYEYFWFQPPHYLEYAEFLALKIGCFVTPTSYPFDSHQCQVFFHTPDKSISRLTFLLPILDRDGDHANSDMPNIVTYHGLPFVIQAQCLKITQNVAFEFLNFGIFHQFLSLGALGFN